MDQRGTDLNQLSLEHYGMQKTDLSAPAGDVRSATMFSADVHGGLSKRISA